MSRLVQIGIVFLVVAVVFAVIDFVMNPSGSPIRTTLERLVQTTRSEPDSTAGHSTSTVPAAPRRSTAANRGGRAESTNSPLGGGRPSVSTPSNGLRGRETDGPPAATTATEAHASPLLSRRSLYLPANRASWTPFDVEVTSPVAIRAAGRVVAGSVASGPNGLSRLPASSESTANAAAVPAAPYLSLVGRVCDGNRCSEPFLVGSNFVVCPSDVKIAGRLQLWTNNVVQVDGRSTVSSFSSALGGYSFDVEPAPDDSCAGQNRRTGQSSTRDLAVLSAGQVLRRPEFTISSSQSAWKPFFIPLGAPLIIRASGTMRPTADTESTGPRGIAVPPARPWFYPGSRQVVVDAEHRLADPNMPYQALIGRLCGANGCDSPFLVADERLICPSTAFNERLELWINHIVGPRGLLGSQTPLSIDAFDLQTRQGRYEFNIAPARKDACER